MSTMSHEEKETPRHFLKQFAGVIIGLHLFVAMLLMVAWIIGHNHPEANTTPTGRLDVPAVSVAYHDASAPASIAGT